MQLINNLSSRITKYEMEIRQSIDRVITSGWLVLGPEVKQFEQSFAQYLGAEHCITLANGTDAIELALKAMGIGVGDRVATVANAGMYATTAMLAAGAEPYFMDVDFETRCTTLAEVKRAIENEVKAVIVTHLYGLAIPEISQIAVCCAQKGVLLLEDCAQAHGAELENQKVGTFGDAACFSFYPTKNLGALGDGGAVVTNNSKLAEQIKLLRQYGWTRKYEVKLAGARNSRLDELQAAILSSFLPHLEAANARRREIAATYSEQIKHRGIRVPEKGGLNYVAHLYVVCSLKRNTLGEHLLASEIASDVHYPIPDYRQPVFDECFADLNLENTERLAKEVLTLPCYPEMTDSQVAQVVHTVNGWQS